MTFTTQTGLAYTVGARVRATATADIANYVEGLVTAYDSGTGVLTFNVDNARSFGVNGGSFTSWNINLAGDVGPNGSQPLSRALLPGLLRRIHLRPAARWAIGDGDCPGLREAARDSDGRGKRHQQEQRRPHSTGFMSVALTTALPWMRIRFE